MADPGGALEYVYWGALALGLVLLVLSLVLDEATVEAFPGGARRATIFFSAVAGFGAGGLLAQLVAGWETASIPAALAISAALGGSTAAFAAATIRRGELDGFERAKLVGMRGVTTLALGPGRIGRITVQYAGMTRSLDATADEDIKAGEEIVVEDVSGSLFTVARRHRSPVDSGAP